MCSYVHNPQKHSDDSETACCEASVDFLPRGESLLSAYLYELTSAVSSTPAPITNGISYEVDVVASGK